jgi:uncharacterized protein YqeY
MVIERLQADLKDAMKKGDAIAVSTLRMLMSQMQYAKIQAGHALTEAETIAVFERAVKTRREAIEQYEKGNRPELAQKERDEIVVVTRYLPQAMTPEETSAAVDALIAELQAKDKRDLGRVMKEFQARHRGRADGKTVSALIASRLS